MPSQQLVDSGYPRLTFFVNDVGQDSLFSITVAEGDDVCETGQVMSKLPDGTYAPYTGAGDTDTAAGILLNRIDPTNGNELGSLLVMGVVRSGSLFGLDANAMTDLAPHFIFV
jgi:hypothetical protein